MQLFAQISCASSRPCIGDAELAGRSPLAGARWLRTIPPYCRFRRLRFVLLALAFFGLGGCQNASRQDVGVAVGAVVGATLGIVLAIASGGDPDAAALGGVIGAGLGGLIGGLIGNELDESERQKAAAAAQAAAASASTERIPWQSEARPTVSGYSEPMSPAEMRSNRLCRSVRSVYLIDGKERSDTATYCFNDGRWDQA